MQDQYFCGNRIGSAGLRRTEEPVKADHAGNIRAGSCDIKHAKPAKTKTNGSDLLTIDFGLLL